MAYFFSRTAAFFFVCVVTFRSAMQSFDEEGNNEDMSFEGFTRPSDS